MILMEVSLAEKKDIEQNNDIEVLQDEEDNRIIELAENELDTIVAGNVIHRNADSSISFSKLLKWDEDPK